MKKMLFIGLLLLTSCFKDRPDIQAQMASEDYLDSVYKPKEVQDKIGIGFIKITDYQDPSKKDYANRSKQEIFKTIISNHTSINRWIAFRGKIDNILSQMDGGDKGYILLEKYKVNGIKYTTAFFIDSTFKNVFARIQL